jgi:dsDNA-binding SOS-regulon protein
MGMRYLIRTGDGAMTTDTKPDTTIDALLDAAEALLQEIEAAQAILSHEQQEKLAQAMDQIGDVMVEILEPVA